MPLHGLNPNDPKVIAAWAAEHDRWENKPPDTATPKAHSFAWGVDLYTSGNHTWLNHYAEGTKKTCLAIFKRYKKGQGDRPLSSITRDDLEAALFAKGGEGAKGDLKALAPIFDHLHKIKAVSYTHLTLPTKA